MTANSPPGDAEQHFFDVADPLVVSRICTFLDVVTLVAAPLAIRSLHAEAFLELKLKVVLQLADTDESVHKKAWQRFGKL